MVVGIGYWIVLGHKHTWIGKCDMVIGIDLVDIDRFRSSKHLDKFIKRFNVDGNTADAAAKAWACLEAVIKAEPNTFTPTDIRIIFPNNSAPIVIDANNVLTHHYHLSVSHEKSLVVAVALGKEKFDQCYN
jgi:phosphopantetheinyl transferase (holo-ACP synthase)